MTTTQKFPLAKKAYEINFDKIDEGYLASGETCYADNRNQARTILLDSIKNDGWKIKYSNDEISYTNIPVVRAPHSDKFHFDGQELTMYQIEEIMAERIRNKMLQNILDDDLIKFAYIRKRGMYYKPQSCGYTEYNTKAGVYPKEEAVKHCRGCDELSLEVIDVLKHNALLNSEINDLKSRIL
ncbi:MAG TPA: hypothetical protein VEA37_12780 [Flavobacterium sp.]|nr:hypothetical protein [Flavobacterium sp.]